MESQHESDLSTADRSGLRPPPAPLHGGPLALFTHMRRKQMLTPECARLIVRFVWLKLRWGKRLRTDGLVFVAPGVTFEIGRDATLTLGRWSWIGHGCKFRVHEGEVETVSYTHLTLPTIYSV